MVDFADNTDFSARSASRSAADNTGAGYDDVYSSTADRFERPRPVAAGARPRGAQGAPGAAGAPQGMPGAPQSGRPMPPRGQYPQGQPPRGGHGVPGAQGGRPMPQGGRPMPPMPPQGQVPPGYPRGAQGAPQGGPNRAPQPARPPHLQGAPGAQGGRPMPPRPQGAPGQYPQRPPQGPMGGAYNRDNQAYRGGAGAPGAPARPGARPAAPGARPAAGAPNVQLVDSMGSKRYGSTQSAGAYKKEYGSTRPKVLRIAIFAILALVLGGVIFAAVKIAGIFSGMYNNEKMQQEEQEQMQSMLDAGKATEPFYMVLVGTDASRERVEEYDYDNNLSDSMMLVRIDPPNKKVTIISLLRDTWVDTAQWSEETWALVDPKYLPYIGSEIKLNSATKYCNSPALLIACVKQLTGVPVSHYAEIDMDGFTGLVDEVGGVEVNIPVDLYDKQLDVSFTAGWQTLDGKQALDLCRMRYAYEEGNTEYGHGGDVYRAANQRMIISALLKKILSSDMGTIMKLVPKLAEYVTIDKGLGVTDLMSLALAFRGLDSATDIYSTRLPAPGGYMETETWRAMISRMEQGLSPVTEDVIDPQSGTILQSAGTGAIDDLSSPDNTVNAQSGAEGEGEGGEGGAGGSSGTGSGGATAGEGEKKAA